METKRKNRYLFHDNNYNGTLVGKINEMCGDEQEEEVKEKQELRKSLLILMMMILPRIFCSLPPPQHMMINSTIVS